MKGGIRPDAGDRARGLDMPEMGALAYPDFLEQEAITLHAGVSPTHEVEREPETGLITLTQTWTGGHDNDVVPALGRVEDSDLTVIA